MSSKAYVYAMPNIKIDLLLLGCGIGCCDVYAPRKGLVYIFGTKESPNPTWHRVLVLVGLLFCSNPPCRIRVGFLFLIAFLIRHDLPVLVDPSTLLGTT